MTQRLRPILRWWRRFKSQTANQLLTSLLTLSAEILAIVAATGLGAIINNANFAKAQNKFSFIKNTFASRFKWLLLVAIIVILLQWLVRYLRSAQERKRRERYDRLLPYLISGAVEDIYRTPPASLEKTRLILQRIESVTRAVLEDAAQGAVLTANIMRHIPISETNRVEGLDLNRSGWGTRPSDRVDICLPIAEGIPGAPEAYLTNQVVYIPDTKAKKVRQHFEGKHYRSIVSIPIYTLDENKAIRGILNIDSTVAKQFHGIDFIKEDLLPKLDPLVKFLYVMWDSEDA